MLNSLPADGESVVGLFRHAQNRGLQFRGGGRLDGNHNRGEAGIGPIGRNGYSLDLDGVGAGVQVAEGQRSVRRALLGLRLEYIAITGRILNSRPADGESVAELFRYAQNRSIQLRGLVVRVLDHVADVNAKASRPEQRVVMSLFCIGLLFFDGNGSVAVLLFVPVLLPEISARPNPSREMPS